MRRKERGWSRIKRLPTLDTRMGKIRIQYSCQCRNFGILGSRLPRHRVICPSSYVAFVAWNGSEISDWRFCIFDRISLEVELLY